MGTAKILVSVLLLTGFLSGALCGLNSITTDSDEELRCSTLAASIQSFDASPDRAYTGEEVTFTATASSTTSTSLTFIIYYDAIVPPFPTNNTNSPYTVHVTDNPGTVTATFTYDRLGNLTSGTDTFYCVRLVVNDGSATTATDLISVYVIENTAPTFESALPKSLPVLDPGEEVNLSVRVSDPDGDPVTANWDFGDGTVAVNTTGTALPGVYFNQTHAWYPVTGPGIGGEMYFSLVVTLEDPYTHTETATCQITVELPPNGYPVIGLSSSDVSVDSMDEVTFYANATDPEGEALTWTFVFNNSYEDVYVATYHTDVTPPDTKVWNNITYAFESPGDYEVRLYVCDGLDPYQSLAHNVTKSISVTVVGNSLPSVVDEIAMSEESPQIDTDIGFLIVMFAIQTRDVDGDVITATWDLDDGGDSVVNISAGGPITYTFRQERLFNQTGIYNVSVVISDGIPGHEAVSYREFTVTSNNMPPSVVSFNFTYDAGNHATPGEEIEFSISLSDPEMDVIEMTWDFGDNSSILSFNLTEYVNGSVTCIVSHSYSEVGSYNVTITYSDNEIFGILTHERTKVATVVVDLPFDRVVDHWSWWDYTALIVILMIPVALVLNLLRTRRRRKRLEAQGVSLEELKLRESILLDEPDDLSEEEVD
ncbi:MAG: PKD domain-containing protein [Methanobacteriota archaeon]|nr:MAG: PKD domain-containing protein [Euryarchaeota archaeon]